MPEKQLLLANEEIRTVISDHEAYIRAIWSKSHDRLLNIKGVHGVSCSYDGMEMATHIDPNASPQTKSAITKRIRDMGIPDTLHSFVISAFSCIEKTKHDTQILLSFDGQEDKNGASQ